MDEVSSMKPLACCSFDSKDATWIVPLRSSDPMVEGQGLSADSEEKRGPASDIDTELVNSLKALDPERPIRAGLLSKDMQIIHVLTSTADEIRLMHRRAFRRLRSSGSATASPVSSTSLTLASLWGYRSIRRHWLIGTLTIA
jgi:hypothetical protein